MNLNGETALPEPVAPPPHPPAASGALAIPDVSGFLARAKADGLGPAELNRGATNSYEALAPLFQDIVEPGFAGIASGASQPYPNWFALAAHFSNETGAALKATELGQSLAPQPPTKGSRATTFALKAMVQLLGGVPKEAAAVLAAMAAVNIKGYLNVKTLWVTAQRLHQIYRRTPGGSPLERVRFLSKICGELLADVNQRELSEMGIAGQQYLVFRRSHPGATPEQVCQQFVLSGSTPAAAQALYGYALQHSQDPVPPSNFSAFAPTAAQGGNLLVAAFALYETAGQTNNRARKNGLIATANNLITVREERDVVAPAYWKLGPPQLTNRAALAELLTPGLRVMFGPLEWTFARYAKGLKEIQGNPASSAAAERNWAMFNDRLPAVLNAFDAVYQHPNTAWDLPNVEKPVDWNPPA